MIAETVSRHSELRITLRLAGTTFLRQELTNGYFSVENVGSSPITYSTNYFQKPRIQILDSNHVPSYPPALRRGRIPSGGARMQIGTIAPGEMIAETTLLLMRGWDARVALTLKTADGWNEVYGDGIHLDLQESAPLAIEVHVADEPFLDLQRPVSADGPLYYQQQYKWASGGRTKIATTNALPGWAEIEGTRLILPRPPQGFHLFEWECIAGWLHHSAAAFVYSSAF